MAAVSTRIRTAVKECRKKNFPLIRFKRQSCFADLLKMYLLTRCHRSVTDIKDIKLETLKMAVGVKQSGESVDPLSLFRNACIFWAHMSTVVLLWGCQVLLKIEIWKEVIGDIAWRTWILNKGDRNRQQIETTPTVSYGVLHGQHRNPCTGWRKIAIA